MGVWVEREARKGRRKSGYDKNTIYAYVLTSQ
jgi:hypothetical protein